MRLDVSIATGDTLTPDECGTGELARLMQVVSFSILENRLTQPGDEARLLDLNGNTAGYARMVPDWTPGELVWVTTREGSLLKARVEEVNYDATLQVYRVRCRFIASHELLTPVIVDHRGHDQLGRPVLARVPA